MSTTHEKMETDTTDNRWITNCNRINMEKRREDSKKLYLIQVGNAMPWHRNASATYIIIRMSSISAILQNTTCQSQRMFLFEAEKLKLR